MSGCGGIASGAERKRRVQELMELQKADVLASLKTKSKALPSKFVPLKLWDRELYEDSQPLIELYFENSYKQEAADIVQRAGISSPCTNTPSG